MVLLDYVEILLFTTTSLLNESNIAMALYWKY